MKQSDLVYTIILKKTQEPWEDSDVVRAVGSALKTDDDKAARIVHLTQLAWCRCYLRDLHVNFSDDYISFDTDGAIASRGCLTNEQWYREALDIPPSLMKHPGFKSFALASSESAAIGELLHKGSSPENILVSPPFFLPSNPSEACQRAAEEVMRHEVREQGLREKQLQEKEASKRKPWWKVW